MVTTLFFLTLNSYAGDTFFQQGKIIFTGDITDEGYLKFKEVIEKNPAATEIILMSGGGSLLAGMAMGKMIKARNLNVTVNGICASSCANYLFIAGNKKRLMRNAVVFFHGGIQQEHLAQDITQFKALDADQAHGVSFFDDGKGAPPDYILDAVGMKKVSTLAEALPHLVAIEQAYYAEMQVNNVLPTYGQTGRYKDQWNSKKNHSFYYDLESMNRLGIKNIEVEGGQWHPEENPVYGYLYQVKYP